MFKSLRYYSRMLQLALLFSRFGASLSLARLGVPLWYCRLIHLIRKRKLPEREGQRLRLALEAMGPTFIKLGQVLSTRADLVSEEVAEDLSLLQDSIPPFPTDEAIAIIEQDFECRLSDLFSFFDKEPVAAASIAQVHFATTVSGKEVAVKVLRPFVREAFSKDIGLLYWLAGKMERHVPRMRRLKPLEVVRTVEQSISKEVDLRLEAASAQKLRDNMLEDDGIYIPEVDWMRTSQNVLTIERVHGTPISDVEELKKQGHDLNQLITKAANSLFKQVFRDGFFHADLHPGNIFVNTRGDIILVDFGIMGQIGRKDQMFIAEIFRGFLNEDYRRVAEVHILAGYVPAHHSVEDFELACMAIGKPILGRPLEQISLGKLLGQLFAITALYDMETQPQLLLLQKNMVMIEGISRMLNPSINMWQLAQPLMEEWGTKHMSIKGKINLLKEGAEDFLYHLPLIRKEISHHLRHSFNDGIKLHPETVAHLTANGRHENTLTKGILLVLVAGLAALALYI